MAQAQPAKSAKKPEPRPTGRDTIAFVFTASMLVSVAAKDISRRVKNAKVSAERAEAKAHGYGPLDTPMERYAFHPGDVRKSAKPSDVLRKAIDRRMGHKTVHTQKNRILLYRDLKLLQDARDLAVKREAADAAS